MGCGMFGYTVEILYGWCLGKPGFGNWIDDG